MCAQYHRKCHQMEKSSQLGFGLNGGNKDCRSIDIPAHCSMLVKITTPLSGKLATQWQAGNRRLIEVTSFFSINN